MNRATRCTIELASILRSAVQQGSINPMVTDEYGLQLQVQRVLPAYARREVDLGPNGRIDFLVRCATLPVAIDVGVELKIAGSVADVARQLERYLEHSEVAGIVLVTTKVAHRHMPDELHGKTITVVWVNGGI